MNVPDGLLLEPFQLYEMKRIVIRIDDNYLFPTTPELEVNQGGIIDHTLKVKNLLQIDRLLV